MNETAQHTPGPWINRQDTRSNGILIFGPDGNSLATIRRRWRGIGEQEANARLFVAAPELLEACKAFVNDAETTAAKESHITLVKAFGMAKAAIANAEGMRQ